MGGDFDTASFDLAYAYYRSVYKTLTFEDVDLYAEQYRGSKEEVEDVLQFYVE